MDIKTIDHLCNLSKLNYTDEGKEKVMGEMSAIIELMDTVKEFDVVYDDTKDNNTQPSGNCYVVPKMVD